MTSTPLPWEPDIKFFKIVCRLGSVMADSDDPDYLPDKATTGGTVSIKMRVDRMRFKEDDGIWRSLSLVGGEYIIQPSTGELVDRHGNVGVRLLNSNSPRINPVNVSYEANVKPDNGRPWTTTFTAPLEGEVVDLVGASDMQSGPITPAYDQRLSTLEQTVFGTPTDPNATLTVSQVESMISTHEQDPTPHTAYDVDTVDLVVLFENGLA